MTRPRFCRRRRLACLRSPLLAAGSSGVAGRRANFPITPQQRSTAQQVAQAGVPLSELAPDAPDEHTVKRGDTLWAISGMFLAARGAGPSCGA